MSMNNWIKTKIDGNTVKAVSEKFGCDVITSSILLRRDLTGKDDLIYYLEDDLRYTHSPFQFIGMEDVVDRIYDAAESKEKVLIFGDRDVDGITATVLMYETLKQYGLDVTYQVPIGDELYGLSKDAVKTFADAGGTLIITVDCGISNHDEIEYAKEFCIDVIVIDHHTPQEVLPDACAIINPKVDECGYPFKDLSGCAVAYKVCQALRFVKTELYKQQLCLFNVRPMQEDSYCVEIIKTVNCCEISHLKEFVMAGSSIEHTKLCNFLQGQQILVWNSPVQKQILKKIFGSGIDFNFFDAYEEIVKTFPTLADQSLFRLSGQSKIAKYLDREPSEIDAFFNIYITFLQKKLDMYGEGSEKELQLVTLSTLADIMPLRNENRILVKAGLNSINSGNLRPGLLELVTAKKGIGKKLGTIDISWEITPLLNATGRMGATDKAIRLFLEEDAAKRREICKEIIELNSKRREKEAEGLKILQAQADASIGKFYNKIVFVYEPQISRGFTGLLASSLFKIHKIPVFVLTKTADNIVVGSARCGDGCRLTDILAKFEHLFLNHGGHSKAAGFSLDEKNLAEFENGLRDFMVSFKFSDEADPIKVDAELPHKYINRDILKIVDDFEPYGEKNPPIVFMSKELSIVSANSFAKNDQSMQISLSGSGITWPCIWWNSTERFKKEFAMGDKVDVLFTPYEDTFNGNSKLKLKIVDMKKSC